MCYFGTPSPTGLDCETVLTGEDAQPFVVQLSWTKPVPYEEVLLYRDGMLIGSLLGSSTVYVDRTPTSGTHTYEVRGRIEVSKSRRQGVECVLQVGPPDNEGTFRRGDANGDGKMALTDAIFTLGFLFLGETAPLCPDAADTDDNGRLDITDPISSLGFLFLGASEPPAPGPRTCGPDPTHDSLGPCRSTCR